jgi:predicted lipoprotein with Yx(FWY)xxD motif
MLLALAAAALLAAGCGDDDNGSGSGSGSGAMKDDAMAKSNAAMEEDGAMEAETASADAAMSAKRKGAVVKVVDSQFGRVIADRKGEALYLFDKEQAKKSECYGECAAAWPPVLTKGKPRAGKGAKAGKLGTTRRRDGKLQVTYAGHPLYYYVDDAPGTILCHDVPEFGGTWLVVKPSGGAAS